MRAITKGREPVSLTQYRASADPEFRNYPSKDELRTALVEEQRELCCYCMSSVSASAGNTKIEHWRSQSSYPHLGLSYANLLAACLGGSGQPPHLQHCDTRKGNRSLKFNPANPQHRIDYRIFYETDGTIRSNDAEFDTQLNEVLGLNIPMLKNRRKGALTAMMQWWKTDKDRLHAPIPRARLERELTKRLGRDNQPLAPEDPVTAWWLKQKLAHSAS